VGLIRYAVGFYDFYNFNPNSDRAWDDNIKNRAVNLAGGLFGNKKDYYTRFP
jgi:hypothetical protein